jgi:hypothetical protein
MYPLITVKYLLSGLNNLDINMITTVNEWKQLNEMNEQEIKLTINLDTPYKWGKGWTGTPDQHEEMDGIAAGIVTHLELQDKANQWDVPEASGTGKILKAYLHPMEYVFTLSENDPETLKKIITTVKNSISMTDFVHIKDMRLRIGTNSTLVDIRP